jgi:hypothetical protein
MKDKIKWRVKHAPAKTTYTKQCHDIHVLTVGFGEPVPARHDYYADGERGRTGALGAMGSCSEHGLETKQARYQGGR